MNDCAFCLPHYNLSVAEIITTKNLPNTGVVMFCHAKKTISHSQAERTQRSVSCLCIVYYRAEDVYCPVARNKQYGRQPGEKSLLAQILNSRAETDRTETKAE